MTLRNHTHPLTDNLRQALAALARSGAPAGSRIKAHLRLVQAGWTRGGALSTVRSLAQRGYLRDPAGFAWTVTEKLAAHWRRGGPPPAA